MFSSLIFLGFFVAKASIAEASFGFSVQTPTLSDNADFFSFCFGKGGNFFLWFLIT